MLKVIGPQAASSAFCALLNAVLQFNQYTIGRAWTSDYGDPQNPEDFDFIYPISPLHNIPTDKVLPPTILFTADREPTFRFVP